jgi:hypothetical protein
MIYDRMVKILHVWESISTTLAGWESDITEYLRLNENK